MAFESKANGLLPGTAFQVFGDARKGAKQYNEDSSCNFRSVNSRVIVACVFDGHGGYNGFLASDTARLVSLAYFQSNSEACESWSVDTWRANLHALYELIHNTIREKFVNDKSTEDLNRNTGNRFVDDKGIVRGPNQDPIHGGSTGTIAVLMHPGEADSTIICANVGDSTALLITQQGKFEHLTVDHGPENADEYWRVQRGDHSERLLYVYDKANVFRKYECPRVFLDDGTKDPVFLQNPWGNGLHPTNVRYEPAVYAVTPRAVSRDTTCIAMTRALGDFYAHQFGLTWVPSITVQKAPQNVGFTVIVASDGIWDCWKYEDFTEYMNQRARVEPNVEAVVQVALNETITRAITNFGSKHYDDACMEIIISPNQKA